MSAHAEVLTATLDRVQGRSYDSDLVAIPVGHKSAIPGRVEDTGAPRSKGQVDEKGWRDTGNELIQIIGRKLTAYIARLRNADDLDSLFSGQEADSELRARITFTLEIARMLEKVDSKEVVQAWFMGANPSLNRRAPLRLIREGNLTSMKSQVLAAAESYLAKA